MSDDQLDRWIDEGGAMGKVEGLSPKVIALYPKTRVSGGNGGPENEHGLTRREQAFCDAFALSGLTYADSYRAAYDASNMQPATIRKAAYAVSQRPAVRVMITQAMADRQERASLVTGRAKAFIAETLSALASDPKQRTPDRLKALELLGKLTDVGAFTERSSVINEVPQTEAQIEERIKDLLSRHVAA